MHFSAGWPTGGTPLPPSWAFTRSCLRCDSACNCAACWANTSAAATNRWRRVRFMGPGPDLVYSLGLTGLLLPVEALFLLAPRLRFHRQGRRQPGDQPRDADGLAGLRAIPVAALVDAAQGIVHLLEELPLAIPGAELERVFFLDRRLVGRVRLQLVLAQVLGGEVRLLQQLPLRGQKAIAEERKLLGAHILRGGCAQQLRLGETAVLPNGFLFSLRHPDRLDLRRLGGSLGRRFLYCFSTKHCSSPLMNRSCGRFLPMNTIVLERFSPLPHGRPTSPPMSMCTPWNTTRWVLPFIYSTPL